MASSVPYTLAADASAGDGAASSVDASSQLISLSTSALACTRARLSCTHSESISRFPWTSLVFCAHSRTPSSATKIGCAETSATRSWLSWLVTSFHPPFSSPTRLVVGTRTSW